MHLQCSHGLDALGLLNPGAGSGTRSVSAPNSYSLLAIRP